jgi:hypothetical protein
MYSRARTTGGPRDLDGADALVRKALEIIAYFQPENWLMENPQTGLLKTRDVVAGLPFVDVTYCKYGYLYRKPTRIWGTLRFNPRPPCTAASPCPYKRDLGRHPACAQVRPSSTGTPGAPREELYTLPPALCDEIAAAA